MTTPHTSALLGSAVWSGLTIAIIAMLVGFPICLVGDTVQRFAEIFGLNTRENAIESLGLFFLALATVGFALGASYRFWKLRIITEPASSPNGGPVRPPGNSGVTEGPPSVT